MAKARGTKKASKVSARGGSNATSLASVATSNPGREFSVLLQTGVTALDLAQTHHGDIVARLQPGVLEGLASDIQTLDILVPGAVRTRQSSKVATMTRDEALSHAHELITAMRQSIHRCRLPVNVQRAYGVGARLEKTVVKSVTSALDTIVKRANEKPEEARSAGIIPSDVERLVSAKAVITGASAAQRQERAAAPVSTAVRNQAARRVILAIDQIAAAGALSAAHDPAVRAQFEALIGAGAKQHPKKTKPAAATATT